VKPAVAPVTAAGRRKHRSAGQGLVEFALVLPVFMIALFGVFDGARLAYMNSVLSQSAREAARVTSVEAAWIGSTDPTCNTGAGPVCPASVSVLLAHANAAANRMVSPFATIPVAHTYMSCDVSGSSPTGNWTSQSCASGKTGSVVSIRVVMTYTAITPLIGQVIPSMSLTGSATMAIN
jgi:Flp pilus assembly protein TadG